MLNNKILVLKNICSTIAIRENANICHLFHTIIYISEGCMQQTIIPKNVTHVRGYIPSYLQTFIYLRRFFLPFDFSRKHTSLIIHKKTETEVGTRYIFKIIPNISHIIHENTEVKSRQYMANISQSLLPITLLNETQQKIFYKGIRNKYYIWYEYYVPSSKNLCRGKFVQRNQK